MTGAQLTHADLQTLLTAAKQHWLHMGANAAIVDSAHVSVGELPAGVAGQTLGRNITLSANGAGWGWFIDPTPLLSEEFSPLGDNTTLQAMRGLGADGQLDLLTVLIHEIGHVLGLDHEDEDDIMGATLEPGVRHLPDEEDAATLRNVSPRVLTSSTVGQADRAFAPLTVNLLSALNPQLSNPGFAGAQGWGTYGEVQMQGGAATLRENETSQTRLNQVFVVNETDRVLSFRLSNLTLDDVENAPDDAFEVALINANTGASLLGGTGLTHNDAFFNLQANQFVYNMGSALISTC